jgi:hypothetical protein
LIKIYQRGSFPLGGREDKNKPPNALVEIIGWFDPSFLIVFPKLLQDSLINKENFSSEVKFFWSDYNEILLISSNLTTLVKTKKLIPTFRFFTFKQYRLVPLLLFL